MAQLIHIEVYRDDSQWESYRWRMARSGKVVADSAEGYTRRASALRAARNLTKALGDQVLYEIRVEEW